MCMTIVASSSFFKFPHFLFNNKIVLNNKFAHPASYATPEGLILSMKRDVNVDSIIIPARVHPNNGPVTIYVPAIESLPFNRKSLL